MSRVVVITGAARGFGRAIAERMGRDGCRIVAWDIDPHDGQACVHVLVNNAGVNGPTVPIWEYPVEDWRRVMSVDLTGVFLCCRSVVPHMRDRGEGRIVNIASIAGKDGNANAGPYSAAKAGVIALTKSLGKELATSGVLVNCITPAMADTDLLREMTPEYIEGIKARIPMGRLCRVEEVAEMVVFLSGPGCTFTTGGVFDLSGGRSVY